MTVLLINPWYVSRESRVRTYSAEPLGLLSLATCLEWNTDAEAFILDAHMIGAKESARTDEGWRSGASKQHVLECLELIQPDLVGITANYTFGATNALVMAKVVKEFRPNLPVILGGAHATLDVEDLIELPQIDIICCGEGEVTLTELVERELNPEGIPGLTWKQRGLAMTNRLREPITELDALPIPSRRFIPYPEYLKVANYFHTRQQPVGTMFTSRGCPFRCMFCSTQASWGNTWRGRSAQSMLKEALYLHARYGVREIAFQDDQFLGDPQRIIDFCRLALETNLGMTFTVPPGNSPMRMSAELLDWMARAGFYRLCFSVDAGTQAVARRIKKPVKLDKIRPLVRHANRRGLWTYGTFVIGHPGETVADIQAGIRYAWSLGLDFVRFYIAQPHLGSELFRYWESRGKINRETLLGAHNIMDAMFGTDEVSAVDLMRLRNQAELGYLRRHLLRLLNPWYLLTEFLPKLLGTGRLKYALGLLWRGWRLREKYDKTT